MGYIYGFMELMVKGNNDVSKGLFVFPENNKAMGLVFVLTNGNKNNKKRKSESKSWPIKKKNTRFIDYSSILIIVKISTIKPAFQSLFYFILKYI